MGVGGTQWSPCDVQFRSLYLAAWSHAGDRAQCILLCSDCSVYSGQDTALTADLPLPFCCSVCLLDRASERERECGSASSSGSLFRKTSSWPLSDVYPNTIFGLTLRIRISSVTVLSQFFETNWLWVSDVPKGSSGQEEYGQTDGNPMIEPVRLPALRVHDGRARSVQRSDAMVNGRFDEKGPPDRGCSASC